MRRVSLGFAGSLFGLWLVLGPAAAQDPLSRAHGGGHAFEGVGFGAGAPVAGASVGDECDGHCLRTVESDATENLLDTDEHRWTQMDWANPMRPSARMTGIFLSVFICVHLCQGF